MDKASKQNIREIKEQIQEYLLREEHLDYKAENNLKFSKISEK